MQKGEERMEENMVKRGNRLIVYVPRELDHHFAEQITETLDQELEKGLSASWSLFLCHNLYGQFGNRYDYGKKAAFKLLRRHSKRHSCQR